MHVIDFIANDSTKHILIPKFKYARLQSFLVYINCPLKLSFICIHISKSNQQPMDRTRSKFLFFDNPLLSNVHQNMEEKICHLLHLIHCEFKLAALLL